MAAVHNDDDTKAKASLSNLQASRIPMMQRMNQQFQLESKFQDYNDDIENLGSKNQTMLHSIEVLESRLKSMRAALHLHPSTDNAHSSSSISSPRKKLPPESTSKKDVGASCVVKSRANDDVTVTSQKFNQQHNISIHHRKRQSRHGRGSGDVLLSTSTSSGEKYEYDGRRSQFLFRIASIEQSIDKLEEIRGGIPAKQAYLTQQMQRLQQRIVLLVSEIDRVAPFDSSAFVTSNVLHDACAQTFTKRQLVRRLRIEETNCRNAIASSRLEAINLLKNLDNVTADITIKREHLNERKSALLQYDKQQATVSKIRMAVSKQPKELKNHYLSLWRREALERRKVRDTLASVATVISRQMYVKAWKHWIRLDSDSSYHFTRGEEGGIGSGDLLLQEARLMDNIEEGAAIVRKLKSDALEGRDLDAKYEQTTFLSDEDELNYLKGEFLFNAKQYEASLRCYERVEAAISSGYLRDETTASDVIELYAKVTNKIGQIHFRIHSIDLAIVYFGRQLSLAQEEHLEVQWAEALIGLSECYIQKHDYVYACDFLQQCLPLISRCDKEKEKALYALLQKCYEHLNKSEEASFYECKIHEMRDTRAERVEAAFERMDILRQRLIDVSASNSRVVQAQASSAKRVSLAKQLKAKEKDVSDSKEAMKESRYFLSQLIDLESEIRAEIDAATNSKKNRIISFRLHDSSQEIKKKELLFRLNERLNITEMKQEECRNDIQSLERAIRNLNDDISELHEKMALDERPLIERVIGQRRYRCVALNTSNTVHENVSGVGNGGTFVAMSNGKECYIHNINSGELETVFMGDVEGQHVGALVGHTATITAVFFYGKRVYTGSLDSSIFCWDIDSTAKLFQSKGHEGAVTCIFYDGAKAISGAADKTIILWSPDGILLHRIAGHVGGVHHIHCCLSCFASSSFESVFVWDLIHQQESDQITRVKCRQRLTLPQGNVSTLHLLGGSELITGDSIGYLKVWNIQSAEALTSVKVHEGAVTSLQADATKAVSCGLDMLVHITDIIQGSVLQTLRGHNSPIFAVAFDQRQIVSVSSDGEIRFWSWGR